MPRHLRHRLQQRGGRQPDHHQGDGVNHALPQRQRHRRQQHRVQNGEHQQIGIVEQAEIENQQAEQKNIPDGIAQKQPLCHRRAQRQHPMQRHHQHIDNHQRRQPAGTAKIQRQRPPRIRPDERKTEQKQHDHHHAHHIEHAQHRGAVEHTLLAGDFDNPPRIMQRNLNIVP